MKIPPELAEALYREQVIALDTVLSARDARDRDGQVDPEYFLRHVFRWYGKTFAVDPLEVENHPLADVVRHYWEAHYEGIADDVDRSADLQRATKVLSETWEEHRRREAEERAAEDDDARWHAELERREAEKREVRAAAEKRAKEAAKAVAAEVAKGESFRLVFDADDQDALGNPGRPRRAL